MSPCSPWKHLHRLTPLLVALALAAPARGGPPGDAPELRALRWLAEQQRDDGRWSGDTGQAGASALALMALCIGGNTHRHGPYRAEVKRGLRAMLRAQASDGWLAAAGGPLADHALQTMALAEAYGMTRSPLLERGASRAATRLVTEARARQPWRERFTRRRATALWIALALDAAQAYELGVPDLDRALAAGRAAAERRLTSAPGDPIAFIPVARTRWPRQPLDALRPDGHWTTRDELAAALLQARGGRKRWFPWEPPMRRRVQAGCVDGDQHAYWPAHEAGEGIADPHGSVGLTAVKTWTLLLGDRVRRSYPRLFD